MFTLKGPHNSGGASVGGISYVPDAQGYVDVVVEAHAITLTDSHGFVVEARPAQEALPIIPPFPSLDPEPPKSGKK